MKLGKETSGYNNGLYTIVFMTYEILLLLFLCYDIMKLGTFWWCYFPFILVGFIIWIDNNKESDIRGSIINHV